MQDEINDKDSAGYALRDQIGFKLSRTSRLMQSRLEAALAPHGVTRLSWCVLSSIGLEGLTTPSGIAANLGVTRPMLSKLIKAMTRDDLIEAALDPSDGRNRHLSLTEKGRETLGVCSPLVRDSIAHFTRNLSPSQLADLHHLVELLMGEDEVHLDAL